MVGVCDAGSAKVAHTSEIRRNWTDTKRVEGVAAGGIAIVEHNSETRRKKKRARKLSSFISY